MPKKANDIALDPLPDEVRVAGPTPDDLSQFSLVEQNVREIGAPIFPGAFVVYLGPRTNLSCSMVGRVMTEEIRDDDDPEKVVETRKGFKPRAGIQAYNFAARDERGRPIKTRLVPATVPAKFAHLRGKPKCVCEAGPHLYQFMYSTVDKRGRLEPTERHQPSDVFEVMVPTPFLPAFNAYVQRRNAAAKSHDALIKSVAG